jgi:hypothetical protein
MPDGLLPNLRTAQVYAAISGEVAALRLYVCSLLRVAAQWNSCWRNALGSGFYRWSPAHDVRNETAPGAARSRLGTLLVCSLLIVMVLCFTQTTRNGTAAQLHLAMLRMDAAPTAACSYLTIHLRHSSESWNPECASSSPALGEKG